jgi:hypothetical protein
MDYLTSKYAWAVLALAHSRRSKEPEKRWDGGGGVMHNGTKGPVVAWVLEGTVTFPHP